LTIPFIAIVNGISKHRHSFMALEYTSQLLGYKPENGTAFPPAEQVDDKVE
jgi:hypothetical protein